MPEWCALVPQFTGLNQPMLICSQSLLYFPQNFNTNRTNWAIPEDDHRSVTPNYKAIIDILLYNTRNEVAEVVHCWLVVVMATGRWRLQRTSLSNEDSKQMHYFNVQHSHACLCVPQNPLWSMDRRIKARSISLAAHSLSHICHCRTDITDTWAHLPFSSIVKAQTDSKRSSWALLLLPTSIASHRTTSGNIITTNCSTTCL